jgi:hypothetical protein
MEMDRNDSLSTRRIHTDADCYDMMYWSIKFGVSMNRLLEAVDKVGPLVADVERHLNGSTAMMAEPIADNRARPVLHFERLSRAGLADRRIVRPDLPRFLMRRESGKDKDGRVGGTDAVSRSDSL